MNRTVLVVDDEWKDIESLLRYLEHGKFDVLVEKNGKNAIETLKKKEIDFIVLDLDMPEMRGDEVIEQINTLPELKNKKDIPIAICTSVLDRNKVLKGKSEYLINAIRQGKYYLFTKPVLALEVIRTIRDRLLMGSCELKKLTIEEEKEYNELGWKLFERYGTNQNKWDHNDPDFKRYDELDTKRV